MPRIKRSLLSISLVLFLAVSIAMTLARLFTATTKYRGNAEPVLVAVLDTGMNIHQAPDLGPAIVTIPGEVIDQSDAGHGTRVAQVIARSSENCRLLPLRLTPWKDGYHPDDIALGIKKAIQFGARIVNISFGSNKNSIELEKAVAEAKTNRVVLVTAAGVSSAASRNLFPQSHSDVIVVAAINGVPDRTLPTGGFVEQLDVVVIRPDGDPKDGSSFATAAISGYIARMLALQPELGLNEVRHKLRTSTSAPPKMDSMRVGFGAFNPKVDTPTTRKWSYHVYPGEIDLSATDDIQSIGATWDCKNDPELNRPIELKPNPLKKGRARITLPSAPPSCSGKILKIRTEFAGTGRQREIDEAEIPL